MIKKICISFILLLVLGGTLASGDQGWMSIPSWVINHQNEQLSMYGNQDVLTMIGGQRLLENSTGDVLTGTRPDETLPSAIDSLLENGDAFLKEGSYQESLDVYNEVITMDPSSYAANYGRGQALEGLGKNTDALNAYKNAVQYNTRSSSPVWHAYGAQGRILYDMQRYLQANDALDRAIQLSVGVDLSADETTELARYFRTKGDALTALNRKDEADRAYRRADELNPSG